MCQSQERDFLAGVKPGVDSHLTMSPVWRLRKKLEGERCVTLPALKEALKSMPRRTDTLEIPMSALEGDLGSLVTRSGRIRALRLWLSGDNRERDGVEADFSLLWPSSRRTSRSGTPRENSQCQEPLVSLFVNVPSRCEVWWEEPVFPALRYPRGMA